MPHGVRSDKQTANNFAKVLAHCEQNLAEKQQEINDAKQLLEANFLVKG
jgi:hypothetical protein